MARYPRRQRVAAYAVILREDQILLSRLAPRVSRDELWTLPGGGLDHGEDPRDAVLREIHEETGLDATVGETARVYSAHIPGAWRDGVQVDAHALRIVYDGWVPMDAPEPRVLEVDGSTVEAAWIPVADVLSGARPVVPMVRRGAGRPPALPAPASGGLCVDPAARRGAADPELAQGPPPGDVDAAGRRDRPRGASRGRPRPRGARGVRGRLRGGRPDRRPRPALQRDGAERPVRGLPRRTPRSSSRPSMPTRSRASWRWTARPTQRPG